MANKTITQLDAAQSLNDNMVIAVQDTNTTYKTTLADVKAYCGGGSGGKYKVGDRVTDDSDNPVGTVSSIFTDGNGDRYAVVCLDAVNRSAEEQWLTFTDGVPLVTGMPKYDESVNSWWYDNAKETATYNTQKILDFCSIQGIPSYACNYCRSKSFTIDGTTYYGKLPNIREVFNIWQNRVQIEQNDPTAEQYSSTNFSSGRTFWSSTQYSATSAWTFTSSGVIVSAGKTLAKFVVPVLEIPLD